MPYCCHFCLLQISTKPKFNNFFLNQWRMLFDTYKQIPYRRNCITRWLNTRMNQMEVNVSRYNKHHEIIYTSAAVRVIFSHLYFVCVCHLFGTDLSEINVRTHLKEIHVSLFYNLTVLMETLIFHFIRYN